jgi:hypothetical protein
VGGGCSVSTGYFFACPSYIHTHHTKILNMTLQARPESSQTHRQRP